MKYVFIEILYWYEIFCVIIEMQSYMIPLKESCDTQDPILELQEVNVLFGPIENIISCHELFYLALSSKTSEWAEGYTIGDSILSSVSV